MTFDEAVAYFTTHVHFRPDALARAATDPDASNALEEARRAIYRYSKWPTQAITYRLGKDQIYALRDEAKRRMGERFSAKTFHLNFISQGTIPSGYFRELLLDELAQGGPVRQ